MKFYPVLQLLSLVSLALARCDDKSIGTKPSCGQSSVGHARRHRKIIGGRDAEPGEHPYQVGLVMSLMGVDGERHLGKCGGSIIDKWHILTAAHCVAKPSDTFAVESVKALLGLHDMRHKEFTEVDIAQYSVHSTWNYTETGYTGVDVALLRTREPMRFALHGLGSVNSICLPRSGQDAAPEDSVVTISGFGSTGRWGSARVLQTTEVRVTDFMAKCQTMDQSSDPDNYLCLLTLDDRSSNACVGDSGGPAAIRKNGRWFLVGLTSRAKAMCRGDVCLCDTDAPAIFTRISPLIDWIAETKLKLAQLDDSRSIWL